MVRELVKDKTLMIKHFNIQGNHHRANGLVILIFVYANFAFSDYPRPQLLTDTVGISHLTKVVACTVVANKKLTFLTVGRL